MNRFVIPTPVIAVVSEELAESNTHTNLNLLFEKAGAPGNTPAGNKVAKCRAWLRLANETREVNPAEVLGAVLEEFMEVAPKWEPELGAHAKRIERVREALAKQGLAYHAGGKIVGATVGAPSRTLDSKLRERDFVSVQIEFDRALASVDSDPASSVTAACAILESLCKILIEDEGLESPREQSIKPLWAVVQKHLRLDPASIEDDDLRRVLSGLTSVVDGLGAFRTHTGSAHGRGRLQYRLESRHARLVIHAAHTLVSFVMETWDARRAERASSDPNQSQRES